MEVAPEALTCKMGTAHILVLDDDRVTGRLLARILEQEGYRVDRAETGGRALELLRENKYQIAFLDIRLPDISGLDVLRNIKQGGARTEVIMQTAFASLENTIEALNRGALSYIIKPFRPQEVRMATRRALEKLRLEEENRSLLTSLKKQNRELEKAYLSLKKMTSRLIASEKQAALQVLGGGIAHELNNPLTSILGLADLLRTREEPGSELSRKLDQIREETMRCAGIVKDLLTFSRQTSGEREEVDVNLVLNKTIQILDPRIAAGKVEVVTSLEKGLDRVRANPGRMGQLFLNLLLNALEAVEETGHPRIEIGTYSAAGSLLIEFKDNGRGIPPDNISRIFEPFFTTGENPGMIGMGLAVCQGIVGVLGGKITVESGPGGGSTFRVSLPGAAQ